MTADEFARRLPALAESVRRSITRRVHQAADAEDVLQTTILRAYQHLARLRDPARLQAWFRRIAEREIIAWRRHRRSASLALESVAERAAAPAGDLVDQFDDVLRALTAVEDNAQYLLTAAMVFGMGWSVREIAAYTHDNPETISRRIRRIKKKLREPAARESSAINTQLRIDLASLLMNAALQPYFGPEHNNMELAREAHRLISRAVEQDPRHAGAVEKKLQLELIRARLAENLRKPPADAAAPVQSPARWNRSAWDARLLTEAEATFERLMSLQPPEEIALRGRFYHGIYAPRTHAGVDWQALLEISRRLIRLRPQGSYALNAAICLSQLDGPLAAAAYLEQHRHGKGMRHLIGVDRTQGYLLLEAGKLKPAKACFQRALRRGVENAAMQRHLRHMLELCDSPRKPRQSQQSQVI